MDAPARRRLTLFAIAAAGAAGIFVLPWFVPVSGPPIVSDSYMLGFANWVSTAALLLTTLALALVSRRSEEASLLPGPTWRSGRLNGRRASIIVVTCLAAASLLSAAGLMWLTRGVASGETDFFLDRMAQLAAGYRPFLDFNYGYALGGLYGPVWLWRAFGTHGLSPLAAYYIVYAVLVLLSFWCLYVVVCRFDLDDAKRAWILACLGLPAVLNLGLGIQYLLVRYLAAPVALIVLHRWVTSARTEGRWRRPVGAAFIALAGLAMTLVVASPEIAVALLLATVCYFIVLARSDRRTALLGLAVYAGCLLPPLALAGRSYFALVAAFAGGGMNFPVLPGPPVLIYLLAACIVAVSLPPVLRGADPAARPPLAGFAVIGAVLVAGAFGRADFGHVYFNGFVVFVLAAAFLARLRPRMLAPFLLVFVLVFGTADYVYLTLYARPPLLAAVATGGALSASQFSRLGQVLAWPPGSGAPAIPSHWMLPRADAGPGLPRRYGRVAAPAGFYESDPETAFELASAGRYAGDPVGGAGFTESDLRAKLADMKRAGALLIPRPFAASIGKATPGDTPHTGWVITSRAHDYWALTLFPLTFYEKNPEPNLGGLLAAAIKQGYRRAGTWHNYVVYVPRTGVAQP